MDCEDSHDIDGVFVKQDEAIKLLTTLRRKVYPTVNGNIEPPSQRRQYRRWQAPESIDVAIFTDTWHSLSIIDVGIGGIKVNREAWIPKEGPFVCRLSVGPLKNILVLSDIMWISSANVGIRFEFDQQGEHDLWAENLVDTLLSKLAI